jgi:hypothetical protein
MNLEPFKESSLEEFSILIEAGTLSVVGIGVDMGVVGVGVVGDVGLKSGLDFSEILSSAMIFEAGFSTEVLSANTLIAEIKKAQPQQSRVNTM